MIVQNQAQSLSGGIAGIEFIQEIDEVAAFVHVFDDFSHLAGLQR